jgi:hypothetical protein
MADTVPSVSNAETEAVMALPAVFSNWFFTHQAGDGLRLTFAERGAPGGLPHPRAAVTMGFSDVALLVQLLNGALAVHERMLADRGKGPTDV